MYSFNEPTPRFGVTKDLQGFPSKRQQQQHHHSSSPSRNSILDSTGNGKGIRKAVEAKDLTYEILSRYFDVPLYVASLELKVDEVALKARCRELGILRWPYRRKSKQKLEPKNSKISKQYFRSFRMKSHNVDSIPTKPPRSLKKSKRKMDTKSPNREESVTSDEGTSSLRFASTSSQYSEDSTTKSPSTPIADSKEEVVGNHCGESSSKRTEETISPCYELPTKQSHQFAQILHSSHENYTSYPTSQYQRQHRVHQYQEEKHQEKHLQSFLPPLPYAHPYIQTPSSYRPENPHTQCHEHEGNESKQFLFRSKVINSSSSVKSCSQFLTVPTYVSPQYSEHPSSQQNPLQLVNHFNHSTLLQNNHKYDEDSVIREKERITPIIPRTIRPNINSFAGFIKNEVGAPIPHHSPLPHHSQQLCRSQNCPNTHNFSYYKSESTSYNGGKQKEDGLASEERRHDSYIYPRYISQNYEYKDTDIANPIYFVQQELPSFPRSWSSVNPDHPKNSEEFESKYPKDMKISGVRLSPSNKSLPSIYDVLP